MSGIPKDDIMPQTALNSFTVSLYGFADMAAHGNLKAGITSRRVKRTLICSRVRIGSRLAALSNLHQHAS